MTSNREKEAKSHFSRFKVQFLPHPRSQESHTYLYIRIHTNIHTHKYTVTFTLAYAMTNVRR